MTFRWLDRWGPLAGALGVVCFIVAIVMYGTGPGDNDTEIVDYFSKNSNSSLSSVRSPPRRLSERRNRSPRFAKTVRAEFVSVSISAETVFRVLKRK